MSTSIDKECTKQLELTKWIDEHFKIKLPTDRKSTLSITCFDLTIEYHMTIYILCEAHLYGSMLAFLRIIFESYVRGLWLRYSATPAEITLYEKDKINITFDTMIKSVESSTNTDSGPLSSLKKDSWKLMNSLTHTGVQHALRRNSDGKISSENYNPDEICSALNLVGTFSLLSAIELASYSGNQELISKALLKAKEYAIK